MVLQSSLPWRRGLVYLMGVQTDSCQTKDEGHGKKNPNRHKCGKNGLLSRFSANINPRMQLGDGVGVNVFVLLPTGTFESDPGLRLNSESSTSVLLWLPRSSRSHDSGSIFGRQRALRIRGVRLDLCWGPQRSTSPAAAPYLGPRWDAGLSQQNVSGFIC